MAVLLKTFMETAGENNFITSTYHQALLNHNVYNDLTTPKPCKNPYYSQEFFNIIKDAVNKKLPISKMKTKDWYNFMIQPIIYEQGSDALLPCKSEITNPLNDWPKSWR